MISSCPRIVIAGTNSGVGKTSLTLGLVRALSARGLRVQTFKVGPDYLDPTYLSLASGGPCYNLDGWMQGTEYVRDLFVRATANADVAIVEGVMGLFDGAEPGGIKGSTAEIAILLNAPVLLVVNAHGLGGSLAALVKGYSEFEPQVQLIGIVANHCGSARHRMWLTESLRAAGLPDLVAAIPRGAIPSLPSRHLGLVTADARILTSQVLDQLATTLETHGSLETLMERLRDVPAIQAPEADLSSGNAVTSVRVGLAWDRAFHFYYQDNLEALAGRGADLIPFSPLLDERLPEGVDGLYIGGGYPEEFSEELAANKTMLSDIRGFSHSGKPLYAECGGLMYLAQGIETLDGKRYPLVGVLPEWVRMLDRRKSLGYVEVSLTCDSLLGAAGSTLRGHEYHYSELLGDPTADLRWTTSYRVKRRLSEAEEFEGFQSRNTLASYIHLHLASRPGSVERFVATCRTKAVSRR
ncbi:MAG: cobyrinate a,c-diamide synthase [Thermodesulfobacteriota bacterium]